jgi:hypothetical protein
MEMVNHKFAKIREIRVLLFPLRVHGYPSMAKTVWFHESLDFTSGATIAKMGKQQLAPSK